MEPVRNHSPKNYTLKVSEGFDFNLEFRRLLSKEFLSVRPIADCSSQRLKLSLQEDYKIRSVSEDVLDPPWAAEFHPTEFGISCH